MNTDTQKTEHKFHAKKTYKDSFFTKLFSEPDRILSLYNAISQSDYPLDTPIEITTLENVFFRGRYNDVSFIVDGKLIVLAEHQSSINPNMPIRFMIYLSKVYDNIVKNMDIYSTKKIQIPRPEFIVLYNGDDDYPDEKIIRLSDLFFDLPKKHRLSGDLELSVRVLNINKGHNQEIVKESVELNGYVDIVDEVRNNREEGLNLNEAVAKAVKDCADKKILTDFLEKYGGEVIDMLYAEWNLDEFVALQKKESKEEGKAEGLLDGLLQAAKFMLQKGDKPEDVSKGLGLPLEQVRQL